MERLIKSVQTIIEEEYRRAAQKFGPVNNSDHESFAVIFEEMQEAFDEVKNTDGAIERFWQMVKSREARDQDKQNVLTAVENSAIFAACEFIQVAVMAHKAKQTIKERFKE
jgi:lipopolysaccharide biosynthesis regulator YciM